MPDPSLDTLRDPPTGALSRWSSHGSGEVFHHRYRLVSLLGEGSMGEVWRAHSIPLGIDVALKLIHPLVMNPEMVQRLRFEAQAMARVAHPALARIFDAGTTASGEAFLAMDIVPGEPLAERLLSAGRLEEQEAVQLALALADALAAVHAAGVVHRDLKPANVLVEHDVERQRWVPRLMDFGIARLTDMPFNLRVSLPGTILGSPRYMAPEQALGRPDVDGRADVWALALILYEMIAGCHPFATHQAILDSEPAPTTLEGGDPELWAILRRGLAQEPPARWPTMEAFGAALASWSVHRGVVSDAAGVFLPARWLQPLPPPPEDRQAIPPPLPPLGAPKHARISRHPPDRSSSRSLLFGLVSLAVLGTLVDLVYSDFGGHAHPDTRAPITESRAVK